MSRIGKKPIALPKGVNVDVVDRAVTVEANGQRLNLTHRPEVTVRVDGQAVIVERHGDDRTARAMHGLTRSLIHNMVVGVTDGFAKNLEIVGVGWSANLKGSTLELNVGYADTRVVKIPAGIKVEVNGLRLKISGCDKQAVGQVAAEIRAHRKPEPYNGKGIKYQDERIIRKQGKAFVGGAA